MEEEKDDLKTEVVNTADEAFLKGLDGAAIAPETLQQIHSYWASRYDANQADIAKRWAELRTGAYAKVQKMGSEAAIAARARSTAGEAAPPVTYSDFEKARDTVNVSDNWSPWC